MNRLTTASDVDVPTMRGGLDRFRTAVMAVAAGCLAVGGVVAPVSASPVVAPSALDEPRAVATSVRDVEFGESVLVESDGTTARATLRFRGRKGEGMSLLGPLNFVERCDFSTLRSRGGLVPRSATGVWMLPRSGSYTLRFDDRCPTHTSPGGGEYQEDQRIALRRVILHRRGVGETVPTRTTRTTVHAGLVTLRTPADALEVGRATITADTAGTPATVEPAARLFRKRFVTDEAARAEQTCETTYLAIGQRPRTQFDERCIGGVTVRRGATYVVFSAVPVRLTPYRTIRTDVDAAKPETWTGKGPVRLSFTGRAGDVVRLDAPALKGVRRWAAELRSPHGLRVDALGNTSDYSLVANAWQLPRDGRFSLNLARGPRSHELVRAVLRSVAVTPLEVGVPRTLTSTDGRWVVALLRDGYVHDALPVVTDAAEDSPTGWKAAALGSSKTDTDGFARPVPALTAPGAGRPVEYSNGIVLIPGVGNGPTSVTVRLDMAPR